MDISYSRPCLIGFVIRRSDDDISRIIRGDIGIDDAFQGKFGIGIEENLIPC